MCLLVLETHGVIVAMPESSGSFSFIGYAIVCLSGTVWTILWEGVETLPVDDASLCKRCQRQSWKHKCCKNQHEKESYICICSTDIKQKSVLLSTKAQARWIFFPHSYRFIWNFFLPLRPRTSLTKRFRISSTIYSLRGVRYLLTWCIFS